VTNPLQTGSEDEALAEADTSTAQENPMSLPRFVAILALLSLTTTLAVASPSGTSSPEPAIDTVQTPELRRRCGNERPPPVEPPRTPAVDDGYVGPITHGWTPPAQPVGAWTAQDTQRAERLFSVGEALVTALARVQDPADTRAAFDRVLQREQLTIAKVMTMGRAMAESANLDSAGAMAAMQGMIPRLMALQEKVANIDPAVLKPLQNVFTQQ
jgi:hypothetical protein